MEVEAEIMMLKAEVEWLKGQMKSEAQETAAEQVSEGWGPDFGLPIAQEGGGETQGTFRWEGEKITHCSFYAGHQIYTLPDVAVEAGQSEGIWYLNVPHANPQGATVSRTEGSNDDDNTAIKLFNIVNGEVKNDYRGMPFVPMYA